MSTPAWVKLEAHIIHPSTGNLLYRRTQIKTITNNQIIHHSFVCWKESVKLLGAQNTLMSMPLWNNPCVPKVISDGIAENWRTKGIREIRDLYNQNVFADFNFLREEFNLPASNFFCLIFTATELG